MESILGGFAQAGEFRMFHVADEGGVEGVGRFGGCFRVGLLQAVAGVGRSEVREGGGWVRIERVVADDETFVESVGI